MSTQRPKNTVMRGKVLSLLRANGKWLAVVAALSSRGDDPVLSTIVPFSSLIGPARRKADRWMEYLA